MTDAINYSDMIDSAMRGMVREVLRGVVKHGLPSEHHFYITFRSEHPGVHMSATLRARYPQEMTVVLQHQFWDFRVEDHQFHVTLSFGGVPERLTIPFAALSAFADPSVKFGLQFQQAYGEPPAPPSPDPMDEESADADGAAEIISLDAFRKK